MTHVILAVVIAVWKFSNHKVFIVEVAIGPAGSRAMVRVS